MASTVAELSQQLEKAERQLKAAKEPDEVNFATNKINRIKAELDKLDKKPAPAPAKKEVPAAKKAAAKKPVKESPVKESPVKVVKANKAAAKPAAAAKKAPAKKKSKYADLPSCDELQEAFLKRRSDREKSQKKHKTKSFINRAASNIATAVGQVAKQIEIPDTKKEGNQDISKIEKAKKLLMEFLDLCEEITGGHVNKSEVEDIFAPFDERIAKLRKIK